jgi:TonB family protein
MLTRLIESQARFARIDAGTAASVAIHILLITVAAFFTTAKAIIEQETDQFPPLVYIHTQTPVRQAASRSHSVSESSIQHAVSAPAPLSLAINTSIPDVNVELAASRAGDDFPTTVTGSVSPGQPVELTADPLLAFDVREVDTPVSMLAGQITPVYPSSLRAAGIEGRVVAQFVVDAKGYALKGSVRILSSSNELFSESVMKAVERMRFSPARIGSKPVSQVVQQLFVFRLDR